MATGTIQKPDQDEDLNPGERHAKELFDDIAANYHKTANPDQENANIENAKNGLNQAENGAARDFTKPRGKSVADQEARPSLTEAAKNEPKPNTNPQKKRSFLSRRNVLIGGGGITGIILLLLGFGGIQPFRLPGIMDAMLDKAGERVQRVAEKRGKKLLVKYAIKGSRSAKNPIENGKEGKLFKLMRESNFEDLIKSKYGLSFEPDGDRIRIVHNGNSLGSFNDEEEFAKALKNNDALSKAIDDSVKKIAQKEFTIWQFFKRTKYVSWLRKFLKMPRIGPDNKKDGESDEDYAKRQKQQYLDSVEETHLNNMDDFFNCVQKGGECGTDSKLDNTEFKNEVRQATKEATKELAGEGTKKASSTVIQRVATKLTTLASKQVIPFVSEIDDIVRIQHLANEVVKGDLLQKKHTQYVLAATSKITANMAGNGDATKAGAYSAATAGMFAEMLNGWTESQAYNFINSGEQKGVGLTVMQQLYDGVPLPEFMQALKTFYANTTWIGKWSTDLWYNTVSKAMDFVFDKTVGNATSWLLEHTGAADLAKALLPYITDFLQSLLSLIGLDIDPLDTGPKLAMYIFEGSVGSFDQYGQDLGMRRLNHEQALAQANTVKQEKIAERSNESFFDRILNLDNPDSYANSLLAVLPTNNLSLASGGINLVTSAPANFARATTSSAYAAPTIVAEDLFHSTNIRGGTDEDLDAPLSPAIENDAEVCPENNNDSFNHCKVDRAVTEAAICQYEKCAEMNPPATGPSASTTVVSGDVKSLAQEILNRNAQGKINFEPGANDGALQDIQLAAAGSPTHPEGRQDIPVTLSPALLQALIQISDKYTYRINALVSDHSYDQWWHPTGKAADIGMVNGQTAITSDTAALYGQFAADISQFMPIGHINQKQCVVPLPLKSGIIHESGDICNHLHVDVGEKSQP